MYLQKDLHIWLVFVILCYDLVIQKVSIEGKSMEILYPISSLKVSQGKLKNTSLCNFSHCLLASKG